jgi:hypothetical protein
MVEFSRATPASVFRVLDREGRPIGQVVEPSSMPVLECGGRTVLLVREEQSPSQPIRACA